MSLVERVAHVMMAARPEGWRVSGTGPCFETSIFRLFALDLLWRHQTIAAGGEHTALISAQSAKLAVFGQSDGRCGPTKLPGLAKEPLVGVAAGDDHTLAITVQGELYEFWQSDQHLHFLNKEPLLRFSTAHRVILIASGAQHSACITSHGDLYTWGEGQNGQLGQLSCVVYCGYGYDCTYTYVIMCVL